jgi:hypothetical protein
MAKPAARITDPTNCPIPGHGPKAIASGSPDVFFDGLAAATKGDTCTCGSALASAVSSTVFINGSQCKPAKGRFVRAIGMELVKTFKSKPNSCDRLHHEIASYHHHNYLCRCPLRRLL